MAWGGQIALDGNRPRLDWPAGTTTRPDPRRLNRLTNRLDGLGQTRYLYAVLGQGQRTVTAGGPWPNDEVTVTNRHGRRAGVRLAQPTGAFVVTHTWDAAGRWSVAGGPPIVPFSQIPQPPPRQ